MGSSKRLSKIEQAQREAEMLNAQVRSDGVNEAPVVQDLLSENFSVVSNTDALKIALSLQELVRGQNSMLSLVQGQGEAITKLTERMNKMDKDAQRWEQDRAGFLNSVQEKADKLKIIDPEKKAKLIANAGKQVQQEIQKAMATKATDDIQFGAWMDNQPKVTVTSMGKPTTVNQAGVITVVMEPEVIRIRTRQWVLPPGIPVDVPQPVAEEFYARQKIDQETNERKKILNANAPLDNVVMAQKWGEISQKFGSQTEIMMAEDRG